MTHPVHGVSQEGEPGRAGGVPIVRVLAVVEHYVPGFKGGGPVRSISNLVDRLGDRLGLDILTTDRDLGDSLPYSGVPTGRWLQSGQSRVRYLSREDRRLSAWRGLLRDQTWDILYLNSVFSRTTIRLMLLRRLGLLSPRPVIIAPRGELQPGALSIHRVRKRAWLGVSRALGLYRGLVWHAASPAEERDIRAVMGGANPRLRVHVARHVPPDLSACGDHRFGAVPPPGAQARSKRPGTARVVFISRISPKKNLDYALRVVASAAADIQFDIYGPIEDQRYWRRCLGLFPAKKRVRYLGVLTPESVVPTFARYDAFLFPTRGESFGQVVFEALHAGCPVLLSDQTPWSNLALRTAGWDLPLDRPAAFAARLDAIAGMDEAELARWSAGAANLAVEWASDESGIEAHFRMFLREASGASASGQDDAVEYTM